MQRKPIEERWEQKSVAMIGGVPWRLNDDDPEVDGEDMEETTRLMVPHEVEEEVHKMEDSVPHRFLIKKEDLENMDTRRATRGARRYYGDLHDKAIQKLAGRDWARR